MRNGDQPVGVSRLLCCLTDDVSFMTKAGVDAVDQVFRVGGLGIPRPSGHVTTFQAKIPASIRQRYIHATVLIDMRHLYHPTPLKILK
jgi:hypothetical protein